MKLVDNCTIVDADICVRQNAAGVVQQMSQQPTIDGSVQGKRWLETTVVCKDKRGRAMSTGWRRDWLEDSDGSKDKKCHSQQQI